MINVSEDKKKKSFSIMTCTQMYIDQVIVFFSKTSKQDITIITTTTRIIVADYDHAGQT